MLDEFPLTYTCKTTKTAFKGKTLIAGESVVIFNHITNQKEVYTKNFLRKLFTCSRDNRFKNKPIHARVRLVRKGTNTKAWKEYLNGE